MSKSRSVVDYATEEALRTALLEIPQPPPSVEASEDAASTSAGDIKNEVPAESSPAASAEEKQESAPAASEDEQEEMPAPPPPPVCRDWELDNYDADTTEIQTMEQELNRLLTLKSYLILDTERDEVFERLTRMAQKYFGTLIAHIGLIDMGRQWFLSEQGLGPLLGGATEVPRVITMCRHTIQHKKGFMVVPDASLDWRFKDNPAVTGGPCIRFYAGLSLITPEGHSVGTLCLNCNKPRPEGLSLEEEIFLKDLGALVVRELVRRKGKMRLVSSDDTKEQKSLSYTTHDLMTPLTGVQLSLSLLNSDDEFKQRLGEKRQKLLSTAANNAELMVRICRLGVDAVTRGQEKLSSTLVATGSDGSQGWTSALSVVKMRNFLGTLATLTEPIPKNVPLVITVDENVPSSVICDDLVMIRCALNLVSNGLRRSLNSSGLVQLKIRKDRCPKSLTEQLVFECTDTGPDVPEKFRPHLFIGSPYTMHESRVGLLSIAASVETMEGKCGLRPDGCTFWFSLPLFTPEGFGVPINEEAMSMTVVNKSSFSSVTRNKNETNDALAKQHEKNLSSSSINALQQSKVSSNSLSASDKQIIRAFETKKNFAFEENTDPLKPDTTSLKLPKVPSRADILEGHKQQALFPIDEGHKQQPQPPMDDAEIKQFLFGPIVALERKEEPSTISDEPPSPECAKWVLSDKDCDWSEHPPSKRLKLDMETVFPSDPQVPMCLLATTAPTAGRCSEALAKLETEGWKVLMVHDCHEALQLLQMRNWNAVFIDDDFPLLAPAGTACAQEFRTWEAQHRRTSRQGNVFILSSKENIPSVLDRRSVVQPPTWYDGVLGKLALGPRELAYILGIRSEQEHLASSVAAGMAAAATASG